MHPWNYGSWTHVPAPNKADGTPDPARIMIVSAPDPADAIRNRFHQRLFRAAIRRAMRQDIPESLPTDVFGRVVLTPDDLKAFKAWLPHQPYLSYDVEWCGLPFTKEFKIVCLAFSHPDSPIVWIFDEALKSKVVHELIKKVLLSVPIVAQNVAAEFVATHCHFGVELEHIAGDTMLAAKLMNVDSKAALEDLAYYIGYNSHKREMNNEYARVREYVDANYPVHLGDASYKSFAMAHVDPDIRARYNALDTFITGELHEEFMRRLSQSQNLYLKKTYQGYILPATKLFHRVHVNGLLVDQRALAVARVKLEQQVHDLEDMLNSEHGIPDPRKVANIRAYIDEHGLFDTLLEHLSYDANGKKVDQRTFDMKKSKYISRKTQEMSTGKLTLKAVKEWDGGDDGGIASVLKYRELSKLLSSYGATLGSYVRDDGRVHPRYRLDGAASGRTCVHQDTLVTTDSGETKIKDLPSKLSARTIRTLTHAGHWAQVTAAFMIGREEMYHVQTEEGHRVTCTAGHKFWDGGAWRACRDLVPGDSVVVSAATPVAWGSAERKENQESAKPCGRRTFSVRRAPLIPCVLHTHESEQVFLVSKCAVLDRPSLPRGTFRRRTGEEDSRKSTYKAVYKD
jgi:hypothetical protein